jgi:hypothetical protein
MTDIRMKIILGLAVIVLLSIAAIGLARADDKPPTPSGYVTCTIAGHCLKHDGEWTSPRTGVSIPRPRPERKEEAK